MDIIYIERRITGHPLVETIANKYTHARKILIDNYSEVFNGHTQNFRLQKNNPSLILAEKLGKRILPTPPQYETGGGAHYYFSHMLNCVYDCRYCFLQGMFRSANYVLFVNYQDFIEDIRKVAKKHETNHKPTWFFSGYDCDSLAFEPITGFAKTFVQTFSTLPNAVLELRTKSAQIRSLLRQKTVGNIVIAYSLSPDSIGQSIESGTPSLDKKIIAIRQLQSAGWRVGIRFDPVIWHADYQRHYQQLIERLFQSIDNHMVHSVTIGGFRAPKSYFKNMRSLHPEHWVLHAGIDTQTKPLVSYRCDIEEEILDYVVSCIRPYIMSKQLFVYRTTNTE